MKDEEELKEGDHVYIEAVVDRVPGEHGRLYRLLTPEGTVVWAHPIELVRKRGSGEGCIMQK